jgi:metal-responsive CopG/Arc/MetJ family transcriptional regulator
MSQDRADVVEPPQVVHVTLPQALIVEMERAANAGHITLDKFVEQAVQRHLSDQSWKKIYAYGEAQTRKLGIKEEDVDRIIHEFRQEERERQNKECER